MARDNRIDFSEEEARAVLAIARKLANERLSIEEKSTKAIEKIRLQSSIQLSEKEQKRIQRNEDAAIRRIKKRGLTEEQTAARIAEVKERYAAQSEALRHSLEEEYAASVKRVNAHIKEQATLQNSVSNQIESLKNKINESLSMQVSLSSQIASMDAEKARLEKKREELQSRVAGSLEEERENAQEISRITTIIEKLDSERAASNAEIDKIDKNNEVRRERIKKLTEAQVQSETLGVSRAEALTILNDKRLAAQKESLEIEEELNNLTASIRDEDTATSDEEREAIKEENRIINERIGELEARERLLEEEAEIIKKRAEILKKGGTKEDKKEQKEVRKREALNSQAEKELEKERNREAVRREWRTGQAWEAKGEQAIVNAIETMSSKITDFTKSIDDSINTFFAYQASINARLQGSEENYSALLSTMTKNIAISQVVRQRDMVEKLKELVDKGVAYNVDLRAFLATVSDKIATTFDAFDANLLKIVRIQQQDTTAARLGMEASLTKLFNEFFSDTSYLTDAFDSVSGAILEASSQLSRDASLEFEYIVQKWLGSLYSLGVSDKAVTSIAEGLNYLGTGNVEALNSNSQLQTLFAMSASRAGIPYADILTGGLSAETTNSLLKSMIEYLQSIARNTDNNQVTKSAYTNMFGISMADLRAINNIKVNEIDLLHQSVANYSTMMDELSNQFNQMSSRVHNSQKLETAIDNAVMSAAAGIGKKSGLYGTWKILNIIEDLTGGIPIPMISVMGNTVDLKQTITGLAKLPIAGIGLMGSLMGGMFGGSSAYDVSNWGYDTETGRGANLNAISAGSFTGVSQSESFGGVTNSDGDAVKKNSLASGAEGAKGDSEITNADVEDNSDIYKQIYEALANEDTTMVELTNAIKEKIYDGIDVRIGALDDLMGAMDTYLSFNRVFYTYETSGVKNGASMFSYSHSDGLKFNLFSGVNDDTALFTFSSTSNPFEMVINAVRESTQNAVTSTLGTSLGGDSIISTIASHSYSEQGGANNLSLIMSNVTDAGLSSFSQTISGLYNSVLNSEKTSLKVEVNNPSTIDVNMKTMGKDVQDTLVEALSNAVAEAISGGDGEDRSAFINALVEALSDISTNVGVTVKNDGFDTWLDNSNRP